MMPPALISKIAAALDERPAVDIATAVAPIGNLQEFLNPSCVKALRGLDGRALYFSRAPVPWPREGVIDGKPVRFEGAWRHVGIYGYRVRSLLEFAAQPPTQLEMTEKLEQLRALWHGHRIAVHVTDSAPGIGVDTPADLERVRRLFSAGKA